MPPYLRIPGSFSKWLNQKFIPDHTALRIAVCNRRKQAFSGAHQRQAAEILHWRSALSRHRRHSPVW
jgi:hypothetical protein